MIWHSVQTVFPIRRPPLPRASLPEAGVTYHQDDLKGHLGGHYPSFKAHTGSCAGPRPSHLLGFPLSVSLCRLSQVPAGKWPFPALSPPLFPRMLGPLPRLSSWCMYSFLPTRHRPSPNPKWVGTWQNSPAKRLHAGVCSQGCRHSMIFRPPSLLTTLVVPTLG